MKLILKAAQAAFIALGIAGEAAAQQSNVSNSGSNANSTSNNSMSSSEPVTTAPGPARASIQKSYRYESHGTTHSYEKDFPSVDACVLGVMKEIASAGEKAILGAKCRNIKTKTLVADISCKKTFGEISCTHRVDVNATESKKREISGTFYQYEQQDYQHKSLLGKSEGKFKSLSECQNKTTDMVGKKPDTRVLGICTDTKTGEQLSRRECGVGGMIICSM